MIQSCDTTDEALPSAPVARSKKNANDRSWCAILTSRAGGPAGNLRLWTNGRKWSRPVNAQLRSRRLSLVSKTSTHTKHTHQTQDSKRDGNGLPVGMKIENGQHGNPSPFSVHACASRAAAVALITTTAVIVARLVASTSLRLCLIMI